MGRNPNPPYQDGIIINIYGVALGPTGRAAGYPEPLNGDFFCEWQYTDVWHRNDGKVVINLFRIDKNTWGCTAYRIVGGNYFCYLIVYGPEGEQFAGENQCIDIYDGYEGGGYAAMKTVLSSDVIHSTPSLAPFVGVPLYSKTKYEIFAKDTAITTVRYASHRDHTRIYVRTDPHYVP